MLKAEQGLIEMCVWEFCFGKYSPVVAYNVNVYIVFIFGKHGRWQINSYVLSRDICGHYV